MSTFPNVPDEAWGVPNRRDSASFAFTVRPYDMHGVFRSIIMVLDSEFVRTSLTRSIEQDLRVFPRIESVVCVGREAAEVLVPTESVQEVCKQLVTYAARGFVLQPGDEVRITVNGNIATGVVVTSDGTVNFIWPGDQVYGVELMH